MKKRKNKIMFALLSMNTLRNSSLGTRYIYREDMYNFQVLDNYVNKFFDIILDKINFSKKEGTYPIWGFNLPESKANLFRDKYIYKELCATGMVYLIAYKVNETEKSNSLYVPRGKLTYIYNMVKNPKKQFNTVIPINKVPIHKEMRKFIKKTNIDNILKRYDNECCKNIIVPRLSTSRIIGGINAIALLDNKYNVDLNERDLLTILLHDKYFEDSWLDLTCINKGDYYYGN